MLVGMIMLYYKVKISGNCFQSVSNSNNNRELLNFSVALMLLQLFDYSRCDDSDTSRRLKPLKQKG